VTNQQEKAAEVWHSKKKKKRDLGVGFAEISLRSKPKELTTEKKSTFRLKERHAGLISVTGGQGKQMRR